MALNLLVEGISMTSIKIRKLLITVEMYHTPMSVFIHLLFKNLKFEFVRIKEIEGELKKSEEFMELYFYADSVRKNMVVLFYVPKEYGV